MDYEADTSLNKKGGRIMRKKQSKKSAWISALLMLGAFTLTFQLGAISALAATPADTDLDGFSDAVETAGITLPNDPTTNVMSLAAYPGVTTLSKCAPGVPRDQCVDKATQDLFVIIQRGTNPCPTSCSDPCGRFLFGTSDIPMPSQYATTYNPLALVYPGSGSTTLGVTTHELLQTKGTSQIIGPTPPNGGWYAVKIVENLNPCSNYMGLAKFGVPYAGSSATVWPEKIKNWINNQCSVQCFDLNKDGTAETCHHPNDTGVASFTCNNANTGTAVQMRSLQPNPAPNLAPLYYEFLQYVISHETSHMMNLASGSGTSADHHYPIAKGILMEQFIGTTVTRSEILIIIIKLI